MLFALKSDFDKWVRKIRCMFCRFDAIDEILAQNGLTTSTTTTTTAAPTTTTTTTTSTTTTTTVP